ncbi:succinylglutamate desuccinylase/aspartoacylase family protein [Clostridium sp. PL3]|uniref:Succinylglutamate desuccinylase/aspartoacylase family protein n=1 Tax=Clostridium thailandense TaxID=2794346 RepID=A0A949U0Q2_9CLOT|nr:M14 family metallopeptidase [Clostridium thailandense]MBV7276218.1 succinylglutamate desuccinylase/aspartoacylase family protein [Clostridium thailandense]
MQTVKVGNMSARTGEKVSGYVQVKGMDIELPVTIICGDKEGKTVFISGGVHNAEYVGIQTAIEIASEISPSQLTGNLIILHLMNRTGFEHRTMSLVYEDGKNLNREFPGSEQGTVADKICHTVVTEFQRNADYYIDLHCGDGYEELIPYVYCVGVADPEVAHKSREMAEMVNVAYLVQSPCGSGGAYNYAGSCGIPSILIERGCMGRWSKEEVKLGKEDIRNVLRYLGVLEGDVSERTYHPVDVGIVIYKNAAHTGCWYPTKRAGDTFKKGEILGQVKDYFGNVLESCIAEMDGILLYHVGSLCVIKGGSMVAYGENVNQQ